MTIIKISKEFYNVFELDLYIYIYILFLSKDKIRKPVQHNDKDIGEE